MKRGLVIGLLIGLVCTAAPAWAQQQQKQPTLYLVGEYSNPERGYSGHFRLFWFEQGDTECYVTEKPDGRAGNGISCLRKQAPTP